MIHLARTIILIGLPAMLIPAAVDAVVDSAPAPVSMGAIHDGLALYLEPNRGQAAQDVRFLYHGSDYHVYLTHDETIIVLTPRSDATDTDGPAGKVGAQVRIQLDGGASEPRIQGENRLAGYSNYLIGNDPERWRRQIPHYARVRYEAVYPGIDLVYYGRSHQVEYDFIVSSDASPDTIRMTIDGADTVSIDDQGNLVLATHAGDVLLKAPEIYQEHGDERTNIDGGYVIEDGHRVSFYVGDYDRTQTLIIDPVIQFSSFLGGIYWDSGADIAYDSDGAVYVTGTTQSWEFPVTAGALDTACGDDFYLDCDLPSEPPNYDFSYEHASDAFVAKIDPRAPEIVYVTYLGGWEGDNGYGVKVDNLGRAVVTGSTRSPDFPTANAVDSSFGYGDCGAGDWYTYCRDGFVARLTADGSGLASSTFWGNTIDNLFRDVALDTAGNAYATGDGWLVLKTLVSGSLGYSYSSPSNFRGYAIDVDGENSAYIAGQHGTGSTSSARVIKMNAAGTTQLYSYLFGGSDVDVAYGIGVNEVGQAIVAGTTESVNFPTRHAIQPGYGGGVSDAFVMRINETGTDYVSSTYLGGTGTDSARDLVMLGPTPPPCNPPICLLPFGTFHRTWIVGTTTSSNFPVEDPIQANRNGIQDAFVAEFHDWGGYAFPGGPHTYLHLQKGFASYLGGGGYDYGYGVAGDPDTLDIYLTGETASADFSLKSPVNLYHAGAGSAFVTLVAQQAPPTWTAGDFDFDDGTGQGWTLDGAYDDLGGGPHFTHVLYEWTDDTDYPADPGTDASGDNRGAIRLYPRPLYTSPFGGGGSYWIMQFHSPDLSDSPSWQATPGYSVRIGEFMSHDEAMSANLFVRVYDNAMAQDRYFFSGTAAVLTAGSWNTLSFDWSSIPTFPADYVVREVFVNIWGPRSDSDYGLDGVYIDSVAQYRDDDGDMIEDAVDNCTDVANADQRDTDGDDFGNLCDADLNNDCQVNFGDLAELKSAFFPRPYDPDADFNGDGLVNFGDVAIMKASFFNGASPGPGPSGLATMCN